MEQWMINELESNHGSRDRWYYLHLFQATEVSESVTTDLAFRYHPSLPGWVNVVYVFLTIDD